MEVYINAYPSIVIHEKLLKEGITISFSSVGGFKEISSFSFCHHHDMGPVTRRSNLRPSAKRQVEIYPSCCFSFCSLALLSDPNSCMIARKA